MKISDLTFRIINGLTIFATILLIGRLPRAIALSVTTKEVLVMFVIITLAYYYYTNYLFEKYDATTVLAALGSGGAYLAVWFSLLYFDSFKIELLLTVGAIVVATAFFMLTKHERLRRREGELIRTTLMVTALCAAIFLYTPFLNVMQGKEGPGNTSNVASVSLDRTAALSEAETEILKTFKDSEWSSSTREEKIEAIEALATNEARYLGFETVKVKIKSLPADTYGRSTHKDIYINSDLVNQPFSGADVINTVAHESRHIYQRKLLEAMKTSRQCFISNDGSLKSNLLFYRELAQWKYEFENYIEGEDIEDFYDIQGYYYQTIEIDARAYADEAKEEYLDYINAL